MQNTLEDICESIYFEDVILEYIYSDFKPPKKHIKKDRPSQKQLQKDYEDDIYELETKERLKKQKEYEQKEGEHPTLPSDRSRLDKRFEYGESLTEEELDTLQKKYELLYHRRFDSTHTPTNVKAHISNGNASVFKFIKKSITGSMKSGLSKITSFLRASDVFQQENRPEDENFLVGFFLDDIFIVSHIAASLTVAIPLLKAASESTTPIIFFVPQAFASMLERIGFQTTGFETVQYYQGSPVQKTIVHNSATTPEDLAYLDWYYNEKTTP